MGKLNFYTEGISLLDKIKDVINVLYEKFVEDPDELSNYLLPFIKEARLLLQTLYSMDIINEDVYRDDMYDQLQALKASINRLPDSVKSLIRDKMKEIYEPIQRDV
jgi:transcription initiation factor IIE alpha subunit